MLHSKRLSVSYFVKKDHQEIVVNSKGKFIVDYAQILMAKEEYLEQFLGIKTPVVMAMEQFRSAVKTLSQSFDNGILDQSLKVIHSDRKIYEKYLLKRQQIEDNLRRNLVLSENNKIYGT